MLLLLLLLRRHLVLLLLLLLVLLLLVLLVLVLLLLVLVLLLVLAHRVRLGRRRRRRRLELRLRLGGALGSRHPWRGGGRRGRAVAIRPPAKVALSSVKAREGREGGGKETRSGRRPTQALGTQKHAHAHARKHVPG